MEKTVKLLMTETSPDVCSVCREQLPAYNIEVDVCPRNGEMAYSEIIKIKPDAVLLDVFMPRLDALAVKKRYEESNPGMQTVFYATGSFQNDDIQREMIESGFAFYFVKPFNIMDLGARVSSRLRRTKSAPAANVPVDHKSVVTDMLREVGVPAHIKGYQFLRVAVLMVVSDPQMIKSVTKVLYPGIAQAHDTTVSRVERAIRHAIEVAWDRGDMEVLNEYFGNTVHSHRGKPTNSEFIAMLADHITMAQQAG